MEQGEWNSSEWCVQGAWQGAAPLKLRHWASTSVELSSHVWLQHARTPAAPHLHVAIGE